MKYLLQVDGLSFKQGVLYHLCIKIDVEYHQMIFIFMYPVQVLQMLPNGQGHQGIEWTIALCRGHFYWNMMYKDVAKYMSNHTMCQVAKGHYVGP